VLVALLLFRALQPWMLPVVFLWWIWNAISR
jgi:hypothetical protein